LKLNTIMCVGAGFPPNRLDHALGRGKPAPTLDYVVAFINQRP
jgi:hypothetical protein